MVPSSTGSNRHPSVGKTKEDQVGRRGIHGGIGETPRPPLNETPGVSYLLLLLGKASDPPSATPSPRLLTLLVLSME